MPSSATLFSFRSILANKEPKENIRFAWPLADARSGAVQDDGRGQETVIEPMTVEGCVEAICNKGCQSVRADIRTLEQGGGVKELQEAPEPVRQAVLQELKHIMAVYGDSCRI